MFWSIALDELLSLLYLLFLIPNGLFQKIQEIELLVILIFHD